MNAFQPWDVAAAKEEAKASGVPEFRPGWYPGVVLAHKPVGSPGTGRAKVELRVHLWERLQEPCRQRRANAHCFYEEPRQFMVAAGRRRIAQLCEATAAFVEGGIDWNLTLNKPVAIRLSSREKTFQSKQGGEITRNVNHVEEFGDIRIHVEGWHGRLPQMDALDDAPTEEQHAAAHHGAQHYAPPPQQHHGGGGYAPPGGGYGHPGGGMAHTAHPGGPGASPAGPAGGGYAGPGFSAHGATGQHHGGYGGGYDDDAPY